MKTLYITDLDGTLLNSDGHPSLFTVNTINSLVDKGMQFTVATARSISSAAGLVECFNTKLPGVMMNGVFLTDLHTKEQHHVCKMHSDVAKQVIDAFVNAGRPPIVYTFDGHINAQFTEIKNDYEKNFIEKRKKLYHSFNQVKVHDVGDDTVYINGIDYKETMDKVAENLKNIKGIKFSYYLDVYSGDKYFIEVYSEDAGKQNTIERLKKLYGFDRVVAFGDNANDVEMLKAADLGVAVGNARPEALDVADVVIDTNNNDGVAKYLLSVFGKDAN